MADQDFTINIRTTANTAGVEQIKAALSGLGAQVQSINAAGGGGGGGGGEGGAGLLDKAAAKIEHGIFRTAVHAVGIGLVYEIVGALQEASKEIEKVSKELDEQGAQLLKNAQIGSRQATFAKDENEALKLTDKSLKSIEETRKKLADLSGADTENFSSFTQTFTNFSDWLNEQLFKNRGKTTGDFELARLTNLKTAYEAFQRAQKQGMDEVLRTEDALNRSYEKTREELERLIAAEEKHKQTAREANQPEDYVKAANALRELQQKLVAVTNLEAQRVKAAQAAAVPLTKALLTSADEFDQQQAKSAREHEASRVALQIQGAEAQAIGDKERAKGIRDELENDRFDREKRKEDLQRFIGLQQGLIGDKQPLSTSLGKEGAARYEKYMEELSEIYRGEKMDREKAGATDKGGSPDVVKAVNNLYILFEKTWN